MFCRIIVPALVTFFFAGCSSIEKGPDPRFMRGEAVVERLSGRVGLVDDGHYDVFRRHWLYRVRFIPSSEYPGCGYSRDMYAVAGSQAQGTVWVAGYELRVADMPGTEASTNRTPRGDRPAALNDIDGAPSP